MSTAQTQDSAFYPGGIGPDGKVESGATIRQEAFLRFAAALSHPIQWTFPRREDHIHPDAIKTIINSAEALTDAAMRHLGLAVNENGYTADQQAQHDYANRREDDVR
jgi:hypothetical protein